MNSLHDWPKKPAGKGNFLSRDATVNRNTTMNVFDWGGLAL